MSSSIGSFKSVQKNSKEVMVFLQVCVKGFPALVLTFMLSTIGFAETVIDWSDLVERGGVYYRAGMEEPFTGNVNGQMEGRFKNGIFDGHWVFHHANGELGLKGEYINGQRQGPWEFYHDNGLLKYKGAYKNDRKEGLWQFYTYDGE